MAARPDLTPDPRLTPQHDGYDYWREQMYMRGEDWRTLYPTWKPRERES